MVKEKNENMIMVNEERKWVMKFLKSERLSQAEKGGSNFLFKNFKPRLCEKKFGKDGRFCAPYHRGKWSLA